MEVLVLAAAVVLAAYLFSIWRRPYRPCWRCHGSKGNTDTRMFRGTFGRCLVCGGSGLRVRWGVRVLAPGTYRAIRSGKHGRNY